MKARAMFGTYATWHTAVIVNNKYWLAYWLAEWKTVENYEPNVFVFLFFLPALWKMKVWFFKISSNYKNSMVPLHESKGLPAYDMMMSHW